MVMLQSMPILKVGVSLSPQAKAVHELAEQIGKKLAEAETLGKCATAVE